MRYVYGVGSVACASAGLQGYGFTLSILLRRLTMYPQVDIPSFNTTACRSTELSTGCFKF